MTTPSTHEQALRPARRCVDVTARAALLRGERGGHLDERAAAPHELVAELVREDRPARVGDRARAVSLHHTCDVQFLDDDDAVAIGKSCGLDVQMVSALPTHFAVESCDALTSLCLVAGSFLLAGDGALGAGELAKCGLQVLWVGDEFTVGGCSEVNDAAVDGDDRVDARCRIRDLNRTGDRDEPLVAVADERAGFPRAFERAMDYNAHRAELRKVQRATRLVVLVDIDSPHLWMRLTQIDDVLVLALPARGIGKLREASLPGAVELDKELPADVARHVGEPGQLGAQRSQLFHLIERRRIATLALRLPVVREQPLLIREVPQEAQRIAPRIEPCDLRECRVGAKAECFDDQHQGIYSLVSVQRKGLLSWQTRCPQPERTLGLREEEGEDELDDEDFEDEDEDEDSDDWDDDDDDDEDAEEDEDDT
jgi:hypothetical protein